MNTMMLSATADVRREFARKVDKAFAPVARHPREDRLAEGLGPSLRIAGMLASAVDLERWTGKLAPEDPWLLALRVAGHTLGGIRAAIGRSRSAVFNRLRDLGQAPATAAGVEIDGGAAA